MVWQYLRWSANREWYLYASDTHCLQQCSRGGLPPGERRLVVAFHSGGTYEYYDVAQVLFDELTNGVPRPWARVGAAVKRHRCLAIRSTFR